MKAKKPQPAPVAIEDQLTCPTCEGLGMISGVRATQQAHAGINIADKESARVRAELTARTFERDGWRTIGLACFEAAFGQKMGGFGAMPPTEVLEAIKNDASVVESLRDAMLGRAWRVRGSQGEGTCDYPLCPNREEWAKMRAAAIDVALHSPPHRTIEIVIIEIGVGTMARLRVCKPQSINAHHITECSDWARWVQARARQGRIEVLP